jgi:hypothetical protein
MAKELTAAQQSAQDRVSDLNDCIAQYEREFKKWDRRAEKVIKKYKDDNDSNTDGAKSVKFNILWSNVQTLVPATFSRLPKPDVSRRFKDNDPVGRVAGLILERGLEYEVEQYPDYAASLKQSVYDRFLGGRGTAWVRYEPHFRAMQAGLPTDGVQVTEDIDEPREELDYECAPVDYVHWKDFGHSVARTWEEVTRVWRIVYLSEEAVRERFGDKIAKEIPYDASPDKKDKARGGEPNKKQAKIYEIWDKEKKTAEWLSKSLNKVIDTRDDPLGLAQFWPCPKPLYATITNDSLVPTPDYVLYQDQAEELNTLSDRIDGLIKALQVKGVYDSSIAELARLFTEGQNGTLIPVKNWAAFSEKNGLQGAIDLVDLDPIAKALKTAYEAMASIKQYIYEITGISDIVRGETNANETLGAQQIKKTFVGLRLGEMKASVARYAAEIIAIKAQIICAKYSPETLLKISAAEQLSEADKPYIQDAIALLIGPERMADPEADPGPNPVRAFRIDIQSDSLVQIDEDADKESRLEFLKATGMFLKEAFPIVQGSPAAAPLLVQMLKFGVTAFKVGKTIEGDFDQALDKLRLNATQPQPPKPDPAMEQVKAQQASDAARLQHEQQKAQMEAQADQVRMQMEAQAKEREQANQAQLERMKMEFEAQMAERQRVADAEFNRWKAQLDADTKILVAEIGAKTQVKTAAMSANAAADPESETELDEGGEVKTKGALSSLIAGVQKNFEELSLGFNELKQNVADQQKSRPKKIKITAPDGRIFTSETLQ